MTDAFDSEIVDHSTNTFRPAPLASVRSKTQTGLSRTIETPGKVLWFASFFVPSDSKANDPVARCFGSTNCGLARFVRAKVPDASDDAAQYDSMCGFGSIR